MGGLIISKRSRSEVALSSDGIQPPNKRRKIEQIALSPFDSLSDDCLLLVLSYLPRDDLNSVAICSKRCREARTNDSLDQTRTGTITCTENTTLGSIIYAFFAQEWTAVFSGNRTRLKVVGLERMPTVGTPARLFPKYLLPNVSSLDLSYNSLGRGSSMRHLRKALAFPIMFPWKKLTSVIKAICHWIVSRKSVEFVPIFEDSFGTHLDLVYHTMVPA
jgi:hypothetical protein